ncbi:MAG: ABC transporter ATP-binding protein [bacterium]|nr:ABC transporter ATP-binding protein [bacterium]
MGKYALEVKNVSKSFRLPTEQANGIKQAFVNWTKGVKGYKEYQVLKDISFKVEKGDFFGIVGRNGSGKSTLLKIISQIYTPEKGSVKVNGTLIPFIELGVGFNPELTGRENIYLNGALLGFSREEISAMYDDIVEFAELEQFMDQKLKNYSSGMQVRLAFSIAIKAQGDILVLDEVLAVGDEAFQRKCDNFFSEIKKDKTKTVILVTHSMESVRKYCNKAIVIDGGDLTVDGSVEDAVNYYVESNSSSKTKKSKSEDDNNYIKVYSDKHITTAEKGFDFSIEYNNEIKEKTYFNFVIVDVGRGGIVFNSENYDAKKGVNTHKFHIDLDIFNSSKMKIYASLRYSNKHHQDNMIKYSKDDESCFFEFHNSKQITNYSLLNNNFINITKK